ncbi:MAG: energy-coupling factor transporter ATPase [Clostridiales bacterium]|jgi:energy-coupling factor transport system ATP-binding protein|nr:energy-coupling factor transporter ATPase [Clostridiales bacterium]
MAVAKIELRNVTYLYNPGTAFEKRALDDVSLKIESGEFIGVMGRTGSGKSTLIQHFNALLKPTSGMVLIDGEDVNADKKRLKRARQKVGLVFQYPEHQLFEATTLKDVAFGPMNMGLSVAEANERAERALEMTGVEAKYYEKSPFELSGGQKRRVAIAGVLAMTPSALVLDEPTAGLDPRGRDSILENICRMHREMNITIVFVSHSMNEIARLCQRVVVMDGGRELFLGNTREAFAKSEILERAGLSAPQMSQVMRKLKEKGMDAPIDALTSEESALALAPMLKKR